MIRAIALQSGSAGNCVFVQANGVHLLIDAGISGKQTALRLAEHGVDIRSVTAVLLSHEHSDHVQCAHVLQRKFGLPLYATDGTWKAMNRTGRVWSDARAFRAGERLRFGDVTVETLATPHDAAESVAYVIDSGGERIGILTDLGHPFEQLGPAIGSLDGVFLESNYDPEMLATGGYPLSLQRRISGPRGHLSNEESAELLRAHGGRLAWACIAHLSENNNSPKIALATHKKLGKAGMPVKAASRYQCSEPMVLG